MLPSITRNLPPPRMLPQTLVCGPAPPWAPWTGRRGLGAILQRELPSLQCSLPAQSWEGLVPASGGELGQYPTSTLHPREPPWRQDQVLLPWKSFSVISTAYNPQILALANPHLPHCLPFPPLLLGTLNTSRSDLPRAMEGDFPPQWDIWQCLEAFLVMKNVAGTLSASSG